MVKEKKDKTISLRISEDDYMYLYVVAFMTGNSVSGYLRMLLNSSINAVKVGLETGKVNKAQFDSIIDNLK